jgi:hypothetical protein
MHFFSNSSALSLAHTVAIVMGGALVDGTAAVGVVLRHVRSDVHVPQLANKIVSVVGIGRASRAASAPFFISSFQR